MRLAYKYRIYPNKEQIKTLDRVFEFCRFLYNCALEERITYYKQYDKSISYNAQAAQLPAIKETFTEEAELIYSQTLQATLKQLDTAYKGFFRRVKAGSGKAGFPRFKGEGRFHSILFPQCNFSSGGVKRLDNDKIKVHGIPGEIKVVWHRPLQGRCKNVRISKNNDRWYLIASCDDVPLNILLKTGKSIGIDLGLNSFITTHKGYKLSHYPKPYNTAKEKLAYLNQKLAAKQRGSNNRKKAKKQLSKAYQKVVNIRDDFQNKTANKLVQENDVIIIEKLNIQKMMSQKKQKGKAKNENIQDASWGSFAARLIYKAERAGRKVIEVNPAYTTQTCSCCGKLKDMPTEVRTYECDKCGLNMDRDHNAAVNIHRLGMSLVAGIKPA
jgi:putative transposase